MGRAPRTSLPDGYFHVYARGARGRELFCDDEDRAVFLRLLAREEPRQHWLCHAFTLLSTHYHLVLETTRKSLSAGAHRLNGRYARHFNGRHGLFGHVFSDRFSARSIEREEHLFDACEYVILNPVKAGLCERVEEWPWSYSRFGLGDARWGRPTLPEEECVDRLGR
jgi:REP element-mobilizing transposase RayT